MWIHVAFFIFPVTILFLLFDALITWFNNEETVSGYIEEIKFSGKGVYISFEDGRYWQFKNWIACDCYIGDYVNITYNHMTWQIVDVEKTI